MYLCLFGTLTKTIRFITQHLIGGCDCCSMDEIRTKVISHSTANILGVQFNAGQDIVPGKRCGSVVTSVINGQSVCVWEGVEVLFMCLR